MSESTIPIFDGDCGFCTRAVRWLEMRTSFSSLPWQMADLDDLELTAQEVTHSVWLVERSHDRSIERTPGSEAFAVLLRRSSSSIWQFIGRVMSWPGVHRLCLIGYDVIARHRHRLPGGTPACAMKVPSP